MRLNLHARIEIAVVAVLLLGSCDGLASSTDNRIEVADVNARNALGRIASLESKLSELESDVAVNKRNIDTAFENARADRNVANSNAELLNGFKDRTLDRLGRIEQRLGM